MQPLAQANKTEAMSKRLLSSRSSNRNLLSVDDLNIEQIKQLLIRANFYENAFRSGPKSHDALQGKTVLNLFFEPSTRTHLSFEIAAKRLGADVVNVATHNMSSTKGETLKDTAVALNAMRPDAVVMRHKDTDAIKTVSAIMSCAVINAGNGTDEHPTQALLDAMTIQQAKGKIEGLKIAICGDIKHSRVAHSNIKLLSKLGAHVNVISPAILQSETLTSNHITSYTDMHAGLENTDVVMSLRLQRERMLTPLDLSAENYFETYGLTTQTLAYARSDAIVLDPGPVLRGVHIGDDIVDGTRQLIAKQVENGVAMRAAVLEMLTKDTSDD